MGVLRSCYSTQARFFYDSSVVCPIVWYWASSDAAWYTGRQSFSPITFSERESYYVDGVGEEPFAPRPWRNGSIPMASPSGVLDGDPRWFEIGQMTSDPGLERTSFGIPVNCAGAPPGVYCLSSIAVNSNFHIVSLLDVVLGYVYFNTIGGYWNVQDLLGNNHGYAECYNYGTTEDPVWDLMCITDLWEGEFLPYRPYPPFNVGPVVLFQRTSSTIGPAVGKWVQLP